MRSAPELATLLLELGRLVRARRYYPPGDGRLAAIFERSLYTWQADLGRRGALDLDLLAEGFRERGARGVLSHPRLTELERDLAERGVERLRFEADLDGDAFAAFAEVLATDAGRTASRGGFAAALYAISPTGIQVNGITPAELAARPPARTQPAPTGSDGSAAEEAPAEPPDPGDAAPAQMLRALEQCEAARYPDVARRAALLAARLFDEGEPDDAFQLVSRLAEPEREGLAEAARAVARDFLPSFFVGPRLAELLQRAAAGGVGDAGALVHALGEPVLPALLDAAGSLERGPERDRLLALLTGFGERTLAAVIERLAPDRPPAQVRAAVRVAAELHHPDLVGALAALLQTGERSVREEALHALAQLGSEPAVAALATALGSQSPNLASAAIHALASSGSPAAAEPLRAALEAALDTRDAARAKELIRALGRLGLPEAAPALLTLLERRARFGGGWLRELKSAAVAALGGISGDEAVAALTQTARSRDAQLRRAAQTALDRRALARARAAG